MESCGQLAYMPWSIDIMDSKHDPPPSSVFQKVRTGVEHVERKLRSEKTRIAFFFVLYWSSLIAVFVTILGQDVRSCSSWNMLTKYVTVGKSSRFHMRLLSEQQLVARLFLLTLCIKRSTVFAPFEAQEQSVSNHAGRRPCYSTLQLREHEGATRI